MASFEDKMEKQFAQKVSALEAAHAKALSGTNTHNQSICCIYLPCE
jgi:hypothetical protein